MSGEVPASTLNRIPRHRVSATEGPLLSPVWVHGQCLDVSIYDRDWPESTFSKHNE
jgi:hypothetical protein